MVSKRICDVRMFFQVSLKAMNQPETNWDLIEQWLTHHSLICVFLTPRGHVVQGLLYFDVFLYCTLELFFSPQSVSGTEESPFVRAQTLPSNQPLSGIVQGTRNMRLNDPAGQHKQVLVSMFFLLYKPILTYRQISRFIPVFYFSTWYGVARSEATTVTQTQMLNFILHYLLLYTHTYI